MKTDPDREAMLASPAGLRALRALRDGLGLPIFLAVFAGAVLGALTPWWGWVLAGLLALACLAAGLRRWLRVRAIRRRGTEVL